MDALKALEELVNSSKADILHPRADIKALSRFVDAVKEADSALAATQTGVTWTREGNDDAIWKCKCGTLHFFNSRHDLRYMNYCWFCGGKITKFEPPLEAGK
jgi:hypothetical protein